MSFNITGIAISGDYLRRVQELEPQLGCRLVFEQEVLLETAYENWKEKKICDICFFEGGTVIFLPSEWSLEPAKLPGEVISFVIDDATRTYFYARYSEKELERRFRIKDGKRTGTGEKSQEEANKKTTTDFIWSEVSRIIGQNFWSVPTDYRAYRYKMVTEKTKKNLDKQESYDPEPISKLPVKPWWKFW